MKIVGLLDVNSQCAFVVVDPGLYSFVQVPGSAPPQTVSFGRGPGGKMLQSSSLSGQLSLQLPPGIHPGLVILL